MSFYRPCPVCGAALDPGERCDCQDEKEPAVAATTTSSRVESELRNPFSTSILTKD